MHRLSEESLVRRPDAGADAPPVSAHLGCPFCTRMVTFPLRDWRTVEGLGLRALQPECPACEESPLFVWIETDGGTSLFVHPPPSSARRPLSGIERIEELDAPLLAAYRSAIASYNEGHWVAAAVLAGRALEGITNALIPEREREGTLAAGLVEILEHRDLEQPILTLAEALRRNPDLADKFAGTLEPDRTAARSALDLLDALLSYLFVLPDRVRRLRDSLGEGSEPPETER